MDTEAKIRQTHKKKKKKLWNFKTVRLKRENSETKVKEKMKSAQRNNGTTKVRRGAERGEE